MNGDVWKTLDWKNSELQGNYNSETDNIKIRHGKKDGIAYIFCSSNSLYKKDDRQDFVSKVVNKDKFEWENITQDIDHEKIIYIRDIWLSWYVVGVNAKYNTIDALIKKMREETEGMQVITVGVSSGGFIAAILASSLKASYCLDFAGQFSLLHHWTHVDTNPFLKELYSKNGHCFGEAYMYLGGLQYIILNQTYVSKTLNRLNMQKCALMLKFFESAQKRMDVLYHLLH